MLSGVARSYIESYSSDSNAMDYLSTYSKSIQLALHGPLAPSRFIYVTKWANGESFKFHRPALDFLNIRRYLLL